MKKLLLVLMLFSSWSLLAQNDATSFSLQEAIQYAKQNHLDIKNSALNIKDAEKQIIETRSIGLPKVNLTADFQHFLKIPTSLLPAEFLGGTPGEFQQVQFGTKNNLTGSADVSWNVFDGSFLVAIRAAATFTEYTKLQAEQVNVDLKNSVTKSYLTTLILNENQAILEKNIVVLTKQLSDAKATFKQGFIEQLDVDRLDLSLRNLKTDLEALKHQQRMAINALKFAMGYDVEKELVIEDDIEGLLATGFNATPDEPLNIQNQVTTQLFDKSLELNQQDIERQESLKLPFVSLFWNNQINLQTNSLFKKPFDWFPVSIIGISARYSLFDGFYARTKIERAKIAMDQTRLQKEAYVNAMNVQVENARIAYKSALEQLDKQKDNLKLAERIYNTTQIKFREGVGTSLEVMQAEQSLYSTQANYLNALYDLLTSKADLDIALGK